MKQTTYIESLMHFSKNIFGAGIFSIGIGFKNAGLILAIIILTLEVFMIAHCVHLLIQSLDAAIESNDKRVDALEEEKPFEHEELTREAREVSFSGMARIIIQDSNWSYRMKTGNIVDIAMKIMICVQYVGNCSLYIIFVGKILAKFINSFGYNIDVHITMVLVAIPMWCLSLVPNVKGIARVSGIGNIFFIIAFIIVNYYLFRRINDKGLPDIYMIGQPETIPILFGVILFAFETVATAFPLRTAMRNPKQLRSRLGVINVGFLFGYLLTLSMGILSYVAYGDALSDTILIDLPSNETAARISIIAVSFHLMSTYPVNLYVPYKILWAMILVHQGPFKHSWIWNNLLRMVLNTCALIVAEAMPHIDLVLSLLGCVCATWLTLFLGPLLNILINKYTLVGSRRKFNLNKNIIIMILAMLIFCIGCSIVIKELIKATEKEFGYNVG